MTAPLMFSLPLAVRERLQCMYVLVRYILRERANIDRPFSVGEKRSSSCRRSDLIGLAVSWLAAPLCLEEYARHGMAGGVPMQDGTRL